MQYSMYMLVNQLILVDQRNSLYCSWFNLVYHRDDYVPFINLVIICPKSHDNDK